MNRKKIISIDFDGTIVENQYPEIGKLKNGAKECINSLYDNRFTIIINTCRSENKQDEAKAFLDKNNIKYHYFNENDKDMIEYFGNDSRKIFADIYIDDKNINSEIDWYKIYTDIMKKAENTIIIGFAGRAGSGKSYLSKKIQKHINRKNISYLMSLGKYVKNIAFNMFNWNGKKDKKGRNLLIGIGNDVGRKYNEDIWLNKLLDDIDRFREEKEIRIFIIDDIRYNNEANICDILFIIKTPFLRKLKHIFDLFRYSKSERGINPKKVNKSVDIYPIMNKIDDTTENINHILEIVERKINGGM